ncbi:Beta-mannosidase B [Lachnellula arida]|uniref:Beta-mannosidase B n=1 Tax=Lachnellula arida TaxID=1316785 RepID=A0A8T9BG53_9HELO|nr:Beta-mannosidase B [Lachnellula arida]
MSEERAKIPIASGWEWKLANTNSIKRFPPGPRFGQWTPASQFPSVIQLEILHTGHITDPNVGENERGSQWVGECDWVYRCSFPTPAESLRYPTTEIIFEGLDTFATVTLNGKEILQSDNMYLPARIDARNLLKDPSCDRENEIVILFESALKKGTELEKRFGVKQSLMRDTRLSLGDWGPNLVTCGPYLPIYLECYASRVENIHVITSSLEALDDTKYAAQIRVKVQISGSAAELPARYSLEVEITDESGQHVAQFSGADVLLNFENPKLWWPNGQGAQHLYTAKVTLKDNSTVLDSSSTRFGIRIITLIQRPLDNEPGKTFMFNVNGRNIFIQGGDWIPADNLLPRLTRERYFNWIKLAKRANMNMIRVWGGGIYGTEDFLDACDELGLLVWHDYAFACGDFPVHQDFLDSIRKEVEVQTLRLRGRACLALICGGNEDFMLADTDGEVFEGTFLRKKIYDHEDVVGPFKDTDFPQREIYLDIIPNTVKRLCPDVQYWPNSPWGGAEANDPTIGDIHQWDGENLTTFLTTGKSYQDYGKLSGRFVSEFGMHGFPDMRTVYEFAPRPEDRHPQSRAIDCHNKGHGAETRIARYLAENFRYSQKLEDFVYVSQLMQSEAYGYSLRDWKRKFGGKGKESCAGLIIWQFNDVYPCTSWSFADYYLRPKPAYYTIRRTFAEVTIGIERTPRSLWVDDDRPRDTDIPSFSLFAHNTTLEVKKYELVLTAYDLLTGNYIPYPTETQPVTLLPNQNTELGVVENPDSLTEESLIVLCAKLVDASTAGAGKVEARHVNWPEPFRYLQWHKDTKVTVEVLEAENGSGWENVVRLTASHPVKGCLLYIDYDDGEDAIWEDNMLDLMPAESIDVNVRGLGGRNIKNRFLNDWELGNDKI